MSQVKDIGGLYFKFQMSKYCCGGCGVGPDEEEKQRRKQHKRIEEELVKDRRKYKATQRLLLLGKLSFKFFII